MTIRSLLTSTIAAGALLATAADARDFRSSDVHPPDYPTVVAVQHMGKLLADQTKGRLGVRVFPNGALGNEKDQIEQVKLGALDMIRINVAPLNSVVPETIVTALPFIFRSTDHMRKALDGDIGEDILKAMETEGMIGLAFYDSGSRSFYTVKKPINSVADLKGMKVRVQQSDLFVAMLTAMGANATPMPYGEVYTALKTGVVDAAENNWPSYESSRHFEVAKYYALSEHSFAPEILAFSKRVFDQQTKEDQALIRKAAKDSVPVMRKLWDEREIASRKMVEQNGSTIIPLANKQEFIDAMKPVYAKFADQPKLQGLVKRVMDVK